MKELDDYIYSHELMNASLFHNDFSLLSLKYPRGDEVQLNELDQDLNKRNASNYRIVNRFSNFHNTKSIDENSDTVLKPKKYYNKRRKNFELIRRELGDDPKLIHYSNHSENNISGNQEGPDFMFVSSNITMNSSPQPYNCHSRESHSVILNPKDSGKKDTTFRSHYKTNNKSPIINNLHHLEALNKVLEDYYLSRVIVRDDDKNCENCFNYTNESGHYVTSPKNIRNNNINSKISTNNKSNSDDDNKYLLIQHPTHQKSNYKIDTIVSMTNECNIPSESIANLPSTNLDNMFSNLPPLPRPRSPLHLCNTSNTSSSITSTKTATTHPKSEIHRSVLLPSSRSFPSEPGGEISSTATTTRNTSSSSSDNAFQINPMNYHDVTTSPPSLSRLLRPPKSQSNVASRPLTATDSHSKSTRHPAFTPTHSPIPKNSLPPNNTTLSLSSPSPIFRSSNTNTYHDYGSDKSSFYCGADESTITLPGHSDSPVALLVPQLQRSPSVRSNPNKLDKFGSQSFDNSSSTSSSSSSRSPLSISFGRQIGKDSHTRSVRFNDDCFKSRRNDINRREEEQALSDMKCTEYGWIPRRSRYDEYSSNKLYNSSSSRSTGSHEINEKLYKYENTTEPLPRDVCHFTNGSSEISNNSKLIYNNQLEMTTGETNNIAPTKYANKLKSHTFSDIYHNGSFSPQNVPTSGYNEFDNRHKYDNIFKSNNKGGGASPLRGSKYSSSDMIDCNLEFNERVNKIKSRVVDTINLLTSNSPPCSPTNKSRTASDAFILDTNLSSPKNTKDFSQVEYEKYQAMNCPRTPTFEPDFDDDLETYPYKINSSSSTSFKQQSRTPVSPPNFFGD